MLRPLAIGSALGLFAGVFPGAYSTLVATSSLRGGFWAGAWVAVFPIVSETIVLGVTALLLSRLPLEALRWMGIGGAAVLFYLAWTTWRDSRSADDEGRAPEDPPGRRILHAALLTLVSPAAWLFWLLVGAPLFLSALREGWEHALVFHLSFLALMVGSYVGVAAATSFGGTRLSRSWRRRMMAGASIVLLGLGSGLVWQSLTGDFARMISGPREVTETVEESMDGS